MEENKATSAPTAGAKWIWREHESFYKHRYMDFLFVWHFLLPRSYLLLYQSAEYNEDKYGNMGNCSDA